MHLTLYYSPGACSLAPHIVLRESNTAFQLEQVNLGSKRTAGGVDFRTVSTRGQVPALRMDDGAVLTEGPVIAQYIADSAGHHQLMPPAGSMARLRVQEWQNYITSELHKSFTPLFVPVFDDAAKALHRKLLRAKYEWVDVQLTGKPFLTGDAFTAADAYLFTVTRWAGAVQLEVGNLPDLQAFMQRVAQRPAVQAALRAEGQG